MVNVIYPAVLLIKIWFETIRTDHAVYGIVRWAAFQGEFYAVMISS